MKIPISATHRMRSTLLALCALTVAASPVLVRAQQDVPPPPPQAEQGPGSGTHGRPNPEQMQARQLEHMQKQLNLTPDQTTQIQSIFADTHSQMRSLHEDKTLAQADKQEKMKSIHESSTARIRAVLTDDQKPKFDKMVARQQEHMEHGHWREGGPSQTPPPPPPPAA